MAADKTLKLYCFMYFKYPDHIACQCDWISKSRQLYISLSNRTEQGNMNLELCECYIKQTGHLGEMVKIVIKL